MINSIIGCRLDPPSAESGPLLKIPEQITDDE
jgi:hypothetical protein